MLRKYLLVTAFLFVCLCSYAQSIGISADGTLPDNSAMLDIKSVSKGLLVPRMTQAERTSIPSPATGLLVYQIDGAAGFYYNSGTPALAAWLLAGAEIWAHSAGKTYLTNTTDNVGIGIVTPQSLLHLHSGASGFAQFTNTTTGSSATDGFQIGISGSGDAILKQYEANEILFQNSSGNHLRINATGLGINAAAPVTHSLEVFNAVNHQALQVNSNGVVVGDVDGNSFNNKLVIDFESGGNFQFLNGNVGVGIPNPQYPLQVGGNVAIPAANSYRYATAKSKKYKIGVADMNTVNPTAYQGRVDDGFNSSTINGLNSLWATGGTAGTVAYFIAPVHLPDSAVINGLGAQVVKNGGSLQSIVELFRADGSGYLANTAQVIATATTTFSSGIVWNTVAGSVNTSFNVVDNNNFIYFIRYSGEQNTQNLRFISATISYQVYRSE